MANILRDKPVIGVAVIVIVVAAVVYINMDRGGGPTTGRWFYDMTTGDLVQVATSDPPPITLDNGHEAVWAHVFACGNCGNADQRFIGYLEKFNASVGGDISASANPDSPLTPATDEPGARSRIASPDKPDEWFAGNSPQAMAVRNGLIQRCPGGRPKPCRGAD
jgi:hypothetical protein